MPEPSPSFAYVFAYASLVALQEALPVDGVERQPLPGHLNGYRRGWGAAMNNWEGGEGVKHFLDRETGERPRIRVAYLDVYERPGSTVNGLALPADAHRLAALDAREVNYARVDVSAVFEPRVAQRVFTYVGLDAARERCRRGIADGDVFVAREYAAAVRGAFERLGSEAMADFARTTDPLPFPERDLDVVLPSEDG